MWSLSMGFQSIYGEPDAAWGGGGGGGVSQV